MIRIKAECETCFWTKVKRKKTAAGSVAGSVAGSYATCCSFFFLLFFNAASVMLPLIVATMCGSEVLRPWIPAADNLSSLSLLH